jgi:hypothetical protein
MIRAVVVAVFLLAASIPAFADEATARAQFSAGERAYNLGDFNKAVELFKKAYEEWPEPAFLFNIAQTYRQSGDCKQALFFYKRFLALKQNDTKKPLKPELKKEVENRIAELEECARRELANKPPDQLDNGSGSTTTTSTTTPPRNTPANTTAKPNPTTATGETETDGENEDEDTGEEPTPGAPSEGPKMISARVLGGAGKLNAGDLDTPLQFFGTIVGGYPLTVAPKVQIELGAALSFTPVPYTTTMGEHGSGGIVGILANAAPSYTIVPKLVGRVEVGVGLSVFTGLGKMGNPFTEGGLPASGPLSTFLARAAISGDYAVTPNVVITATPIAFAYQPAPTGFSPSITSLTTLSFMVGVGYQQ